jgi:hypothetical protein
MQLHIYNNSPFLIDKNRIRKNLKNNFISYKWSFLLKKKGRQLLKFLSGMVPKNEKV